MDFGDTPALSNFSFYYNSKKELKKVGLNHPSMGSLTFSSMYPAKKSMFLKFLIRLFI